MGRTKSGRVWIVMLAGTMFNVTLGIGECVKRDVGEVDMTVKFREQVVEEFGRAEEYSGGVYSTDILIGGLMSLTRRVCHIWQCLPSEIWAGSRRRSSGGSRYQIEEVPENNVSKARAYLHRLLQRHVGRGKQTSPYRYYAEGRPAGTQAMSDVDAATWLGVDHSALVVARHAMAARCQEIDTNHPGRPCWNKLPCVVHRRTGIASEDPKPQ